MAAPHSEGTEPRIVKKKKVAGGHHGGAWKVAYADFVTAMMALFIVLWIMSQSQSIRLAVAQYFKNPGLLPGAVGLMETSDMGGTIPTPGHSQELQTPAPITPEVTQSKDALEEVKKRLQEIIAQLPELHKLKDQVLLEVTPEGLRIELLERENSAFFDIGSAELQPEAKKMLALIAQELGKLPNQVAVEGHTDSRPYGKSNYTNWELSVDRANAARRRLDEGGLRAGQVTAVRGFADRLLRNRQDPMDYQNRRVSIIVVQGGQEGALGETRTALAGAKASPGEARQATMTVEGKQAAEKETAAAAKPIGVKPQPPPAKDTQLSTQVDEELKKLFEPFRPKERLGW